MRAPIQKRWIAFVGFIAVFLALALNLDRLSPIDETAYALLARLQCGPVTAMFKAFTQLVHPVLLVALTLVTVMGLRKREYIVPACANLGISVLLNLGLKSVFTRVRPQAVTQFISQTGYSFPSGHAMAACTFYGFLIYLTRQSNLRTGVKNALSALLGLVIALVCLSRVYLGAHYFTDVLAGACVSSAYLIVFTGFVTRYFREGQRIAMADANMGKAGTLLGSFAHALDGVFDGLKAERNMVIHFGVATLVVVFGVILRISMQEWIACALCCAVVMAAELMNTAIETTVDLCSPEYSEKARRAKDTAAGAVLILAIGATVVGALIFAPKLMEAVLHEFVQKGGL